MFAVKVEPKLASLRTPGDWAALSSSVVGTMLKPSSVKPDDYHALPGEEPVANPVVGEAQVLTVEEPAVRVVPPVREERRCCRGCLATACCGLFICCAVIAGVALACVYGILNKPNVNVKHNVVNARAGTIVANFHNANPYAVDVGKLELVVWLKAGHKRALGRFEAREGFTVGRYSGAAVTLYNASAMDAGVVAKIGERRGPGRSRRAGSGRVACGPPTLRCFRRRGGGRRAPRARTTSSRSPTRPARARRS